MKLFSKIKRLQTSWNTLVKTQLRKVGIFQRLNATFLLLLLASALFLTFFAFYQYSAEINLNLDRYVSLLVQNVELKIQDTLADYENVALRFYNDGEVIQALMENSNLTPDGTIKEKAQYEKNSYTIESKLYNMRSNSKNIVNIQFVTPNRQYHMVEPSGYQRGGTIRDLEAFYQSEFYLLPQEKRGYPIWMDSATQTSTFYKNEQNVYGIGNIITLGVAVYSPANREFLGVLLLNIDLNAFSGAMEGYEEYNDGNTFLIGQDGVLTWFNPSISAPSFPKDRALLSEMVENGQHVLRTKIDQRHTLLAYEKIPGTKIFVAYIADLAVLLGRTYQIRNLCILLLFCIVIASFVISYYVTISISDPIRQLVSVMKKAGAGTWTARYTNSGNDEITILGDRFNDMADKTNQLIEQVYLSEIKRQRILLSWKTAQLNAMMMQINPHFLYNTLDIIRWEAMYEAGGESTVTQMIEKFSRLCRMGMRTGSNTISLREGIEHATTYMDVINFRHNDKIKLTVDTQVDIDSTYIPQFMLQPIMENAVVHAFGDASKGCCIKILAYSKKHTLYIAVEDNGKGMTEEEKCRLESLLIKADVTEKSIGLINVHQRIQLFYGDEYRVSIFSKLGYGSRIEITLPVRDHSENMENSTDGKENSTEGMDKI